jgi:deoxyribodipyrimidine photo-lyase
MQPPKNHCKQQNQQTMNRLFTIPTFPTDEAAILQRMEAIDPTAYSKSRNYINGAVTYLSPYISRGVISTRQVWQSLQQRGHRAYQIEKLVQELAWREFFQRVWQAKGEGILSDLRQPQPDVAHRQMPQAVMEAQTGIEAVDQLIEQLYQTGYMHNHARMYVASIACNIDKAHWLQPAQWLYHHLLDGDLASNHLSWQWVAGAFSNKKYYCNQSNINQYTGSRQQGSFLDMDYDSLPQAKAWGNGAKAWGNGAKAWGNGATAWGNGAKAWGDGASRGNGAGREHLQISTALPATPLPTLDTQLPTLLYNSYNLDPRWRTNESANRVLLLEPSHFALYPVSGKVLDFIIALGKNIPGLQLYCGEVEDLALLYKDGPLPIAEAFIAKEHPAFGHYPGIKDQRAWLFPQVTGYFPSFFGYWKKCERLFKQGL